MTLLETKSKHGLCYEPQILVFSRMVLSMEIVRTSSFDSYLKANSYVNEADWSNILPNRFTLKLYIVNMINFKLALIYYEVNKRKK